jgi:hypothetical protein
MLERESAPGTQLRLEGLGKLKKKKDLIGARSCDLPACSIVVVVVRQNNVLPLRWMIGVQCVPFPSRKLGIKPTFR